MGLRAIAESDNRTIQEDSATGFGDSSMVLIDPNGTPVSIVGLSNDISVAIDPETGQLISGRVASASFNINTIFAAGFTSLPVGVSDETTKPWRVQWTDLQSNAYNFKVQKSNPDHGLGTITLLLEIYTP